MTPQCKRVMEHLNSGRSLTSDQAAEMYGIKRLAARISELRSLGYPIGGVRENGKNRYGEDCHWERYFIVGEADDLHIAN